MAYGIMRCAKVSGGKGGSGAYMHNERKNNKSNTNPDIDFDKSDQNFSFGNYDQNLSYNKRADKLISEKYTGKRAIRKDAVKMVEFLFAPSNRECLTPKQHIDFLQESYNWLCDRFGKDNVIADTVHLDEKTPHLHAVIVPLTVDGRLSAKEVIGNPQKLQKMQDSFYENVSKKFGLERGERADLSNPNRPRKKHIPQMQFKKQTIYNLDKELTDKEKKVKSLDFKEKSQTNKLNALNNILDTVQEEYQEVSEKLSEAQNEILDKQLDIYGLNQDKKQIEANISDLKRNISDLETDLGYDEALKKHTEGKIQELEEKYEELKNNPPERKEINIDYKADFETLIKGIDNLDIDDWNKFCELELTPEAWDVLAQQKEFSALRRNQGIEF